MACAYHGQKADCGPECAGFLYPNPDAAAEGVNTEPTESVGPEPGEIAGELTEAEAEAVASAGESSAG